MHACATAKLESQRTAGSKTPRKGAAAAGRTKLLLHYCRTQETPGAPGDTRGNKEGHQRDRRAQRHHEDRGEQRGDRERHQDDWREQRGDPSIGAGRKATGTGTQHISIVSERAPGVMCWVLPGLDNASCLSGPVRPLRLGPISAKNQPPP
jgi:hypothetical protein